MCSPSVGAGITLTRESGRVPIIDRPEGALARAQGGGIVITGLVRDYVAWLESDLRFRRGGYVSLYFLAVIRKVIKCRGAGHQPKGSLPPSYL
jgi:hypothetical protein